MGVYVDFADIDVQTRMPVSSRRATARPAPRRASESPNPKTRMLGLTPMVFFRDSTPRKRISRCPDLMLPVRRPADRGSGALMIRAVLHFFMASKVADLRKQVKVGANKNPIHIEPPMPVMHPMLLKYVRCMWPVCCPQFPPICFASNLAATPTYHSS